MEGNSHQTLLDEESLAHLSVGVSVSESADLGRLGLTEAHVRLALGEIARVVILAGGTLVYGGHLRPGYTDFLESEVGRYGQADQSLRLCIAWSEHRSRSLSELKERQRSLGGQGTFVYLNPDGQAVKASENRSEGAESVGPETARRSLTGLRQFLTSSTSARVFLGGKERGFAGRIPGVMEEALLAIRARQPLFFAGGFGGATASMAELICNLPNRWPPHDLDRYPVDAAAATGLDEIREAIASTGWTPSENRLTDAENKRLATTHRPSEVASLVAIGLDRITSR